MRSRWSLLLGIIVAIVCGVVFTTDAQAKYAEGKSLTITVNVERKYTISFNANGGTGTMADQEFTLGVSQALRTNTFAYEGYTFAGWNTETDGSGTTYEDGASVNLSVSEIGSGTVILYAMWDPYVSYEGACTFNGRNGVITGDDCEWADGERKFIDTGIQLYNEENYNKDYEFGFTIVEYTPSAQEIEPSDRSDQAVFVNSKYENSAVNWPGIVVRKSSDQIEITQTINGEKESAKTKASTTTKIDVARVDGVIYLSINDGPFEVLQVMPETPQYFDTSVWFGAADKGDGNGTPMRFLKATLSNIYVRIVEHGISYHTVTFDAQGGTVNLGTKRVIGTNPVGELPAPTRDGFSFAGWFTEPDGGGEQITENSVIEEDVTAYAYWRGDKICEVNGVEYATLQEAITAAGTSSTPVEITLLSDTAEHVTVNEGQNITFNMQGYVMRDDGVKDKPVINNYGKVTITNGTITSKKGAGVVDNKSTGAFYMSGGQIIATGTRQALYNDGGHAEISGDAYLSAVTTARAAVQNLNNGTLIITGGTIISTGQDGVRNDAGSLTLGVQDDAVNVATPMIRGANNGITTTPNISFYDGIIKGKNAAINNINKITATEPGAQKVEGTETINGESYHTLNYE